MSLYHTDNKDDYIDAQKSPSEIADYDSERLSHQQELDEQTSIARGLVERCERYLESSVSGCRKLHRKCLAELNYLRRISKMNTQAQSVHLLSSNLQYLQGIVEQMETRELEVIAVLKSVPIARSRDEPLTSYDPANPATSVTCVDVVRAGGAIWVKIIAKKAQTLHLTWAGKGNYGKTCILTQAKCLQRIAKNHLFNYSPPQIILHFRFGLTEELKNTLESHNFRVELATGAETEPVSAETLRRLANFVDSDSESSDEPGEGAEDVDQSLDAVAERNLRNSDNINNGLTKCNLDITALICLVSNLNTPQGCKHEFVRSKILKQQANEELQNPMLKDLHKFIEGKELYACRTAVDSFASILSIVGGPAEKLRAEELMNRVKVVDDATTPAASSLKLHGHVKERAKKIFGTGDSLKAVTITANCSFIRAAHNQKVDFVVHLIKPRALSEQKE